MSKHSLFNSFLLAVCLAVMGWVAHKAADGGERLAALLVVAGCASTRPLKPGVAKIQSTAPSSGAQFASELKQPENPAQSAAQNFERVTETELPLPAGTKVQATIVTRNERTPDAPPVVSEKTITLAQPTVQTTRTVEKSGTTIGAAQKDTARELGAKLSSLKGIVWVGVAVAVGGWFLAHRHGRLQGVVDTNKDGLVVRQQNQTQGDL